MRCRYLLGRLAVAYHHRLVLLCVIELNMSQAEGDANITLSFPDIL